MKRKNTRRRKTVAYLRHLEKSQHRLTVIPISSYHILDKVGRTPATLAAEHALKKAQKANGAR